VELGLEVSEQAGWTVVRVAGEVDTYAAPQLRERLVELVTEGQTRLVVDLRGVDFLDSTGLGVLVGALKRARGHDGDLAVACAQERIRKVFEITRLDRVFPMGATVEAAIEAATSRPDPGEAEPLDGATGGR
jgi:anti-sigma B factor antagonist